MATGSTLQTFCIPLGERIKIIREEGGLNATLLYLGPLYYYELQMKMELWKTDRKGNAVSDDKKKIAKYNVAREVLYSKPHEISLSMVLFFQVQCNKLSVIYYSVDIT